MMNRRQFFSRSGVAMAVCDMPRIAHSAATLNQRGGQKPRHIIHLVADGMSWGTLNCADLYSRLFRKRPLAWMRLYERSEARFGFVNMRSLNSVVTDSAAAASSWGCGSRVFNGAINTLPNGLRLTPLCSLLADAGWRRALVTTTEITHATPAGFAANALSRDNAQLIAAQYLERQLEVLFGGGRQYFDPVKRRDKRDLKGAYAQAGYQVVENTVQLKAAKPGRLMLGTFADSHLPFAIDRAADPKLIAQTPTLADMVQVALRCLEGNRFFMLVEGGRVDHAAHNSDAAAAMQDMIALDEAFEVCLAFQQENPDTLLVITTDHGNANPGLNGMGGGYGGSPFTFANLGSVRASYPEILAHIKKRGSKTRVSSPKELEKAGLLPYPVPAIEHTYEDEEAHKRLIEAEKKLPPKKAYPEGYSVSASAIIEVVEQHTGYRMPRERAALYRGFLLKRGRTLYDQMNSEMSQLGQLMANHLGVGWTGNSHTADYVPLLALGPGMERFAGLIQNTDIFAHYTALAGIDYKNPEMPVFAQFEGPDEDVETVAAYAEPFGGGLA